MKLSCLESIILIVLLTSFVGPAVMLGLGILYFILPREKQVVDRK